MRQWIGRLSTNPAGFHPICQISVVINHSRDLDILYWRNNMIAYEIIGEPKICQVK